jgi:putative flavoprotein involved in K+ transport
MRDEPSSVPRVTRDIVIVGGGPAGLAAAAHLKQIGCKSLILEQGQTPGGAWRSRRSNLRLTTPRRLSSLPFYRMEARYGRWPSAAEWSSYLIRYASRMRCEVECNQRVWRIERARVGWLVHATSRVFHARVVVVATGEDRVPVFPDVPGIGSFRGRLVHASDIHDMHHSATNVLVIGSGTSGGELATMFARKQDGRVWLSVRHAPVILPRQLLGIPMAGLGHIADRAPPALIDCVATVVKWMAFGRLSQMDRPDRHRLSERRHRRYAPTIDDGLAREIRRGNIEVVPAVESFDGSVVHLSGGRVLSPDLTIAATGYRPSLAEFVAVPGVLDDNGRPLSPGDLAGAAPGLFFVGLRPRVGPLLPYGRREAARVADAIGRMVHE